MIRGFACNILFVTININIMKKITTLVTLFIIVSFGLFISFDKVNADIIIPSQIQKPVNEKIYSVAEYISLHKTKGTVLGYVVKNEQIPWSCVTPTTVTVCSTPMFTDYLIIADTIKATDGLWVGYGGYDSRKLKIGYKYNFQLYQVTSSTTGMSSFVEVDSSSISSSTSNNNNLVKFEKPLRQGASGQDVKNLQIFLNSQGFNVSASGVGSQGNETIYFGSATYRALIKFQNYYASSILTPVGLTQGTGYFGPSTINKVNQLIGN